MNDFDSIIKRMTVTRLEPGDYTGEDGLLYCGKCRTPKQFRMEAPPMEGRLLPHPCHCEQEHIDRDATEQEARRHRQAADDLKRRGFTDPAMRAWTFANDNGKCPQMKHACFYVENWTDMQEENIGYLLWGGVGTGKSYFAGCIANALMEQEVAVCYLYQGWDVKEDKDRSLKNQILVIAPHEGIVSSDIWLKCWKKLMANTTFHNGRKARNTWLARKVKCGKCGYALKVTRNPSGYEYLRCTKRSDHKGCPGGGTLHKAEFEQFIFTAMGEKFRDFCTTYNKNHPERGGFYYVSFL